MYYIQKYHNCWAIFDDLTGGSRKLTETDIEKLKIEFDSLKDEKVLTIYTDKIRSIDVVGLNFKERGSYQKTT